MGLFDWEGEDKLMNQVKQAIHLGIATSVRIWNRVIEIQDWVGSIFQNQLRFLLMELQQDALEREWRQSVTDATAVFSRIDRNLGALDGRVRLDKHKLKEHEAMIQSFEDNYSRVLFRVHALEQKKKEYEERIVLKMAVSTSHVVVGIFFDSI